MSKSILIFFCFLFSNKIYANNFYLPFSPFSQEYKKNNTAQNNYYDNIINNHKKIQNDNSTIQESNTNNNSDNIQKNSSNEKKQKTPWYDGPNYSGNEYTKNIYPEEYKQISETADIGITNAEKIIEEEKNNLTQITKDTIKIDVNDPTIKQLLRTNSFDNVTYEDTETNNIKEFSVNDAKKLFASYKLLMNRNPNVDSISNSIARQQRLNTIPENPGEESHIGKNEFYKLLTLSDIYSNTYKSTDYENFRDQETTTKKRIRKATYNKEREERAVKTMAEVLTSQRVINNATDQELKEWDQLDSAIDIKYLPESQRYRIESTVQELAQEQGISEDEAYRQLQHLAITKYNVNIPTKLREEIIEKSGNKINNTTEEDTTTEEDNTVTDETLVDDDTITDTTTETEKEPENTVTDDTDDDDTEEDTTTEKKITKEETTEEETEKDTTTEEDNTVTDDTDDTITDTTEDEIEQDTNTEKKEETTTEEDTTTETEEEPENTAETEEEKNK